MYDCRSNLFSGEITLEEASAGVAISVFSLAVLYLFGNVFRHLIGTVYVSKQDSSKICISHLTFFGNRNDIVRNIDDIVPLSDVNMNMNDIFLRVCPDQESIRAIRKSLFLSTKYGGILDRKQFVNVFGPID